MKLGKITINRKHEMFWNSDTLKYYPQGEIINRKHEMFWNPNPQPTTSISNLINRKHEMFWNFSITWHFWTFVFINRKHEMFWNKETVDGYDEETELTVNMKCFEIYVCLKNKFCCIY